MLGFMEQLLALGDKLQTIYFLPLSFQHLYGFFSLSNDLPTFAFFVFFNVLVHMLIIYFALNFSNSFPYFGKLFGSILYAFPVSFALAKVFQIVFLFVVSYLPLVGLYLQDSGVYFSIIVALILEYLILKNRFDAYSEREEIDSEVISSDLLIGVFFAHCGTFALYFFLRILT